MKASVHFAAEPTFCATPFYQKQCVTVTPPHDIQEGTSYIPQTAYMPSPSEEDESNDRKILAGRTPHNKLTEAAKNVEIFKKNLLDDNLFGIHGYDLNVTQS